MKILISAMSGFLYLGTYVSIVYLFIRGLTVYDDILEYNEETGDELILKYVDTFSIAASIAFILTAVLTKFAIFQKEYSDSVVVIGFFSVAGLSIILFIFITMVKEVFYNMMEIIINRLSSK